MHDMTPLKKPVADAMAAEVARNYAAMNKQVLELLKTHEGQWALMRHGKIVEIFPEWRDAESAGINRFPDGVFSLEEVALTILTSYTKPSGGGWLTVPTRVPRPVDEADRNRVAIQDMLPALVKTHKGRHALMRRGTIIEFFSTKEDASKAGKLLFYDGVFSTLEVDVH